MYQDKTFQQRVKKATWKQIGVVSNLDCSEIIQKRSSKSKFVYHTQKSQESLSNKQSKIMDCYYNMNKQVGKGACNDEAISKISARKLGNQTFNDSQNDQGKKKFHFIQHVNSTVKALSPKKIAKKNLTFDNYKDAITNLQKQFKDFRQQIFQYLQNIENYYVEIIQKLEARYLGQIKYLQTKINQVKQSDKPKFYQMNPQNLDKNQIKITFTRRLSEQQKKPIHENDEKVEKQSVSSLSELATGIKKVQFKNFAETFEKMKLFIDEQVSAYQPTNRHQKAKSQYNLK